MKSKISIALLLVVTHGYVFAEDFTEFKGQPLSLTQREQMENDLMDWAITNHERQKEK